ncbi:MAG: hypothetical protein EHM75_09575 [Desulfobacteraceae bacterium]|nr:MAG: hypothetical protein EHM75_09575 [Desulfobacteraceae bacterium]
MDVQTPGLSEIPETGGLQVITTHLNADFDGLASMLAAKKLYPEALWSSPGPRSRTCATFSSNPPFTYIILSS